MEEIPLKEFIISTLIDIAEGVRGANEKLNDTAKMQFGPFSLRKNIGDLAKIPGIQFDIAVTATKSQKDKAGFMVALLSIGAGAGAGTEKGLGNEMVHRIKFEVGCDQTWR